ncbi:MAG TPA: CAP domain-containing protein [Chloroflexota bacterium]
MRRLVHVVFLAALVSTLAAMASTASAAQAQAPETAMRLVALINQERQHAGLPPLAVDASLTQAAQSYANVLAATGCWSHTCGPVPDVAQRLRNAGFAPSGEVGENLAAGTHDPSTVMALWMQSPPHRANVLNPTFARLGVGVAEGGPLGVSWVAVFAGEPLDAAQAGPNPGQPTTDRFRSLLTRLPHVVGTPVGPAQSSVETGDLLQRTTRGLLVWRAADRRAAFTNGYFTWIDGPFGVQVRLNAQRFPWEP